MEKSITQLQHEAIEESASEFEKKKNEEKSTKLNSLTCTNALCLCLFRITNCVIIFRKCLGRIDSN